METKKVYIHYIIALALAVILAVVLQPTNGLTVLGVRAIAVIVPTLYLWLTCNTHWTCMMVLALLAMTQVMTANEVWANSTGNFIFITIMTYMILNICLAEHGVINKIAMFFITRKICEGRPYIFMGMFFLSQIVIGFFVNGVSLAAIYLGIAEGICENLKLKKGDSLYTVIMYGTMVANTFLAIGSPMGNALPNVMISLVETQTGYVISYPQWMAYGALFSIVGFLVMMLVIRIWNMDVSAFKDFDVNELRKDEKPLDKAGKWTVVIFALVIFFVIVPAILVRFINTPLISYLNSLGFIIPALIGVVLLCIIHVDGKPVLNFPEATKKLNLPSIIFAGTVACLAVPMSSESTGIGIWLGNILKPLLGDMNPAMAVIVLVILAMAMTNFLSNTVTEALFFSIGVAVLGASGYNLVAFAIIIAFAAGMATLTPSAAVPSPFFFGPGHLTMKSTIKPNLIHLVLMFLVVIFFATPLANIMF